MVNLTPSAAPESSPNSSIPHPERPYFCRNPLRQCPIEGLLGYTIQIGGLLHDDTTLMAARGQCAQTAMQIDQCLRNELLFRHVHSKVSSLLVSAIFGLLGETTRNGK
jgi:hypothetical protein